MFGCYGWSGEGNSVLRKMLTDAGFEVVQTEVKSSWNPGEDDFAKIPALVSELIGTGAAQEAAEKKPALARWQCPCGYIYDPAKGDPEHNVKPGTAFEDVPADWTCPVCGLPKESFRKID